MTFMPWTEEYAVGIEQIDEQHRWLFDCTNALYDGLSVSEPDHGQVAELLESLIDYTMNHFIAEEELMQRFGYPDFVPHKAQHDEFNARIMDMLQRHEGGEVSGVEALDLLVNWLINHIGVLDNQYVDLLKSKGID